jgi:hypothetical protein
MTAREAAEFGFKEQERVVSLNSTSKSYLRSVTGSTKQRPTSDSDKKDHRESPQTNNKGTGGCSGEGLKGMATAMADGEGAMEGLECRGGDMAVVGQRGGGGGEAATSTSS